MRMGLLVCALARSIRLALPASNRAHRQPAISNRVEMLCSLRDIRRESVRSNFNEAEKARRKLFQQRPPLNVSLLAAQSSMISLELFGLPSARKNSVARLAFTMLQPKHLAVSEAKHCPASKASRSLSAGPGERFFQKGRRPLCLHLPEKSFPNSSHG